MIAGFRYSELGHMPPGLVCDLFVLRVRYDDQQHGITRKQEGMTDWEE